MDKNEEHKSWACYHCGGSSFWGWFFVVFGGYFLLRELGIIPTDLPVWQILIILFGVYLISRARKR